MLSGIPVLPTEFEMQVRQLGLTPQTYVQSAELRRWCERNCHRCYVPECLLGAWNIAVDADLGNWTPIRPRRTRPFFFAS